MSFFLIRNFTFKAVLAMVCSCLLMVHSQEECGTNLENVLAALMSPDEPPTMQVQALRNELIRRIKGAEQREELENDLLEYKRSLSSLARWNNMPGKRNLESLARAGYIRTLPTTNEPDYKRNYILARNVRNALFPLDGQSSYYDLPINKRNVASLARSGMKLNGKRNVAALLRQDNYLNNIREGRSDFQTEKPTDIYNEKRNIASIKAQYKPKFKRSIDVSRVKREADYYDLVNEESPVYQSLFDYDEGKEMDDDYQILGKRFLGRIPQMGKLTTTPSPKSRYN